jgi:hypothetical protein
VIDVAVFRSPAPVIRHVEPLDGHTDLDGDGGSTVFGGVVEVALEQTP